jgi:hypothetical protein
MCLWGPYLGSTSYPTSTVESGVIPSFLRVCNWDWISFDSRILSLLQDFRFPYRVPCSPAWRPWRSIGYRSDTQGECWVSPWTGIEIQEMYSENGEVTSTWIIYLHVGILWNQGLARAESISLGGSLGNVPQKLKKKTCYSNLICFFKPKTIFKSTIYTDLCYSINCTFEKGPTNRNISSFYNTFFNFCGTLPSDPPNFIKTIVIIRQGVIREKATHPRIIS